MRIEVKELNHLSLSRARRDYVCAACGETIKSGIPYFRDEPHPMARRHRGARTRQLCTVCATGRPPSQFVGSSHDDSKQLKLPFIEAMERLPRLLFQAAVVQLGADKEEGRVVESVALPWFEIVAQIARDPSVRFQLPWRRLEELIAGAYEREGWDEVMITPPSGDHGRDIIAVKHGICKVRIIDQVKAYGPQQHVKANDVRALLGVLSSDLNVTKGFVTTTADFAPKIAEDPSIKPFIPYRLELKDGSILRDWLVKVARGTKQSL